MPFKTFDTSALRLAPLAEREHDLDLSALLPLDAPVEELDAPALTEVAAAVRAARGNTIVMLGAHVLRSGVQAHLFDLMERGLVSHVAMNGGAAIHDFELALIGATTESVARYVQSGEFGLWRETGRINEVAKQAAAEGIGLGEALGREIDGFAHADVSLLARAHRLSVPATVHVGIGYDIVHEHPGCDGGAWGAASYTDFLVYAHSVSDLEHGVLLNLGSAVMGPEVFLKALSMARNVAHQRGQAITRFTTAVFDLRELGPNATKEPPRDSPAYYFRPLKTLLVRTVADGGRSYYIRGPHRVTIPNLHRKVVSGR